MRGDFGVDDEDRNKELEDELGEGDQQAENRQAEDRESVIEMTQEEGLPVETKVSKQDKTEKVKREKVEGKSPEPLKTSHRNRNVFCVVVAVVLCAVAIGGSLMAGAYWQRRMDAEDVTNGSELATDEALLGGGGGIPLKNVAKMPSDDKLALAFLKMHNDGENSCYSPLSIRYALEMLREGADGETKAQIDSLLGNLSATKYDKIAGHLSLANSLWIKSDLESMIRDSYKEALREKYGAEVKTDDFRSAANINAWIEDNTLGLIQNALTDEDVSLIQAAVVNALALDMEWEHKFMREFTFGGYFDFEEEDVDNENLYTTLKRYGGSDVYYNFAADATVLAQDLKEYEGTKLQFVALMPDDDLDKFINELDNNDVNRLLSGLRMAMPQNDTYDFSFTAYIPKFSIKGGVGNLIQDLRELGVVDAFSPEEANFSGMVDDTPFWITTATHKTTFDLSEEGIKAAAVTLLGGMGAAGGPGPIPSSVNIVVSINKPFMYLVRDVKTGEIWFTGTVYEPNKWADEKADYSF